MKLGIVGTGKIVCEALPVIRATRGIAITAVCSRPESAERARALSADFGIGHIYDNYDEFLRSGLFDTVYLGVVNSMHYEYARRALSVGLNVICEKPFTSTAAELDRLIALSQERKLILIEAVTVLFSPPLEYLGACVKELGAIRLVQCNYSQASSRYKDYLDGKVQPVFDPVYSGGALYDINVYNLHYVSALFGPPDSLSYHANKGPNGIDTSGVLTLDYPGFKAVCCGAKDCAGPSYVIIQGEEGWAELVGAPNNPAEIRCLAGGRSRTIPLDSGAAGGMPAAVGAAAYSDSAEPAEMPPDLTAAGRRMAPEFRAFARIIDGHNYDEAARLLEHSRIVMDLLEKARADAGIVFAADGN